MITQIWALDTHTINAEHVNTDMKYYDPRSRTNTPSSIPYHNVDPTDDDVTSFPALTSHTGTFEVMNKPPCVDITAEQSRKKNTNIDETDLHKRPFHNIVQTNLLFQNVPKSSTSTSPANDAQKPRSIVEYKSPTTKEEVQNVYGSLVPLPPILI